MIANRKSAGSGRPAQGQKPFDAGRRRRSGSAGFSLIETIITLLVLSIAAVGVLSVFTTTMRGSTNPLFVEQAAQAAQGELDAVIGLKAANGFSDSSLNVGIGQTCKTSVLTGFTCSLAICFVSQAAPDDTTSCTSSATELKRVEVTITNESSGANISIVSLLADY